MLKKSQLPNCSDAQQSIVIFKPSGGPKAANSANKLEHVCLSVCLCVHASVCVSFVLSNTNCIPYSATYDALKKSRMKHNSRNHFFPRTKSRSLLGSMSWCRRAKAQDLSSLLQTQGNEASLIVLPYVHLKLLVPQDWIMAIRPV